MVLVRQRCAQTPAAGDRPGRPADVCQLPFEPPGLSADHLESSLLHRFAEIVDSTPAAVAVHAAGRCVTFAELDRWSNGIANSLYASVGPGRAPVALLTGPDEQLVAGVLGALKAGRPYTLLDPAAGVDWLHTIWARAQPAACLWGADQRPRAVRLSGVTPRFALEHTPADRGPALPHRPADPASVVFTSGSTGRPKGVVAPHRYYLHGSWALGELLGTRPGDRLALVFPPGFAAFSQTLFRGLTVGASLHLYDPRGKRIRGFPGWLSEQMITELYLTPSLIRALVAVAGDAVFPDLTVVGSTGEPVYGTDFQALRRHLTAQARLVNMIGTSETYGIGRYVLAVSDALPAGPVPAGCPPPGKQVLLLDPQGRPVPAGEVGEIVVRSRFIADGYWRDPQLTAERFAELPGGDRSYRTGDLGRLRADGCLEYLGRRDYMIKVSGYLVEPAEVEAAALATGLVEDVAVAQPAGRRSLTCYLVPRSNYSQTALRQELAQRLPRYMLPTHFVSLHRLPRNPSGKVDRSALPAPAAQSSDGGSGPFIDQVAAAWARVLDRPTVRPHDDFFESGGDSLAAEELAAILDCEYGIPVAPQLLIEAPTLETFTARLSQQAGARQSTLVALRESGTRTPLFCIAGAAEHAMAFLPLARRLGAEQPVWAWQANGFTNRGLPDRSVPAAARRCLKDIASVQPAGPYLLLGHSSGGQIACELARQLRSAGQQVAQVVLLDVRQPWQRDAGQAADVDRPAWRRLAALSGRCRTVLRLTRSGLAGRKKLPEHHDLFFRHGQFIASSHRIRPWDGPALVVTAADETPGVRMMDWSGVLTGPVCTAQVPGNHLTMLKEPQVERLAAILLNRLPQATGHPRV